MFTEQSQSIRNLFAKIVRGSASFSVRESGRFSVFLVLNFFYSLHRGGFNGFITEKTILFQHFPGRSNFFPGVGGVQMLFFLGTHIT